MANSPISSRSPTKDVSDNIDESILVYAMVVSSVAVSRLREMLLNRFIPVKKSNILFMISCKWEPKKIKITK